VASPFPVDAWDSEFACPIAAHTLMDRCNRAVMVIRLTE